MGNTSKYVALSVRSYDHHSCSGTHHYGAYSPNELSACLSTTVYSWWGEFIIDHDKCNEESYYNEWTKYYLAPKKVTPSGAGILSLHFLSLGSHCAGAAHDKDHYLR